MDIIFYHLHNPWHMCLFSKHWLNRGMLELKLHHQRNISERNYSLLIAKQVIIQRTIYSSFDETLVLYTYLETSMDVGILRICFMICWVTAPVFPLAWLKLERVSFYHKEYCFSNRVIGLAILFCWHSQTIMPWLSSH